ncbi:diguanylate cyclase [Chromohalobacter marismortui]|uniref:diguanylate cyclase n=1 Tax=Chromohalobacter marismortui TaxID=42055 RepID=A0A4V3F4D9_9GAMM|nr:MULTISPECIES: diguanylate cyclase [Chromohalobacter]MCI0510597.1 diguanylate cyclase [Chromohalobacter sp.]MCI0591912.1 diguanylate cyclase [Chromohalobacter sp.]TDU24826.1 diguanylate cyclase [Chromohalobacter marismortui]
MPHSLNARMIVAAIVPFMIMLTGCLALYQASQVEQRTARSVAQTLGVIADANHLMRLFMDAETAQRGYAITQNGDYLAPYQRALSMFPRTLSTLRDSARGKAQQQRLERANRLFRQWVKNVANVRIVEAQGKGSVLHGAAALSSKRLVDEFRTVMGEFIDTEQAALHARQADSQDAAKRAQRIMIGSSVLALVSALVTWWPLFRRTRRAISEITQRSQRMVAGDLSQRVALRGRDEFAWMAHAFNAMAARLETLVATEKRTNRELAERVNVLVRERTRDMRARHALIEALHACRSTQEAQSVLHDQLPTVFANTLGGTLWCLGTAPSDAPHRICQWGQAQDDGHQGECLTLRDGWMRDVTLPVANAAHVCPHLRDASPGRHLCIALKGTEEPLGVLHLHLARSPDQADNDASQAQSAQGVAEDIALSLSNVRLREQLEEASIRDALTGLYNRRFLDETLTRELARAERQPGPLSVLMLDIDHFKPINDEHGHAFGDKALIEVAELLGDNVRRGDIICRYGGEEFVIIMPGAGLAAAQQRGEHLRQQVATLDIAAGNGKPIHVTVSLGLACYPQHGEHTDSLLHHADMALYEAKQRGRNRLIVAGD